MTDGSNPFGGFSIVMDDDQADGTAVPAPGGPSTMESGEGRVDSKLFIVGSGPAGLTAAISAARANLEPIVIAGSAPGGPPLVTNPGEDSPGLQLRLPAPSV